MANYQPWLFTSWNWTSGSKPWCCPPSSPKSPRARVPPTLLHRESYCSGGQWRELKRAKHTETGWVLKQASKEENGKINSYPVLYHSEGRRSVTGYKKNRLFLTMYWLKWEYIFNATLLICISSNLYRQQISKTLCNWYLLSCILPPQRLLFLILKNPTLYVLFFFFFFLLLGTQSIIAFSTPFLGLNFPIRWLFLIVVWIKIMTRSFSGLIL